MSSDPKCCTVAASILARVTLCMCSIGVCTLHFGKNCQMTVLQGCASLDFYQQYLVPTPCPTCNVNQLFIFVLVCLSQHEWEWILFEVLRCPVISSSVNGLSIIFSELFSVLQFSKTLTKILKEKMVNLLWECGVDVGGKIWVRVDNTNKDRWTEGGK